MFNAISVCCHLSLYRVLNIVLNLVLQSRKPKMPVLALSFLALCAAVFPFDKRNRLEHTLVELGYHYDFFTNLIRKFIHQHFEYCRENFYLFGKKLSNNEENLESYKSFFYRSYMLGDAMEFSFGESPAPCWVKFKLLRWFCPKSKDIFQYPKTQEEKASFAICIRWEITNYEVTDNYIQANPYAGILITGGGFKTYAKNIQDGCSRRPELNEEQLNVLCNFVNLMLHKPLI